MKNLFLCFTLFSVSSLAFSSLADNRYSRPPYSGNSFNHGGRNYQAPRGPSAPVRPSHPGSPAAPLRPAHPSGPSHPSVPSQPRQPVAPAYRAPAAYGAGRPYGAPSHYSAPAPVAYGAPHSSYGSNLARGPAHYAAPSHNVYQPQRPVRATSNYQQNPQQQHSSYTQSSQSQSHGREMKYTINDPHNKGTTHVTETHVVSNREMHGAEAEAAMKKLMGGMGPGPSYGSDGGFQDFVKNMGLSYF